MWYWAQDGRQQGPVEAAAIDTAIRQGHIDSATLLWRSGLTGWRPAGEMVEFTEALLATETTGNSTGPQPPPLPSSAMTQPRSPLLETLEAHSETKEPDVELPDGLLLQLKPRATPWSRYWARMVDGIFLFPFALIDALNVEGAEALLGFGLGVLSCLLSAICLSAFGTTPGKALYCIDVIPATWSGQSHGFFRREFGVFYGGLGLGISIAAIGTMYWQYTRLQRGLPASYDVGRFLVIQRPIGQLRFSLGPVFTALALIVIAAAAP